MVPAVMVLMGALCWLVFGGVGVSDGVDAVAVVLGAGRWGTGPAGCGRWSVLGGFLCLFVVGEGVLGVVLGAGVAGVADGVPVGSGCVRW